MEVKKYELIRNAVFALPFKFFREKSSRKMPNKTDTAEAAVIYVNSSFVITIPP
ncbi:MAG: hypothetical protein IJW21_03815 [Clostridia bacterium]|nr:hypothetical protein [Clostridia bacterium]